MKIKRKIPVIQAILKQALFCRFPEIENFYAQGDDFYICVPEHADVVIFAEHLGRYTKHLLDEFGAPGACYTFHLLQRQVASYRLVYSEINNMSAIAV